MKILTDTGLMVLWNKIKQLVLGNRPYNPSDFSGKGYKVLEKNIQTVGGVKKNILTAIMINQPNTIYEIRYDFDLGGETVEMQEGCTLKFNGGSLTNGNLVGNNTYVKTTSMSKIFSNIIFGGNWNCNVCYAEWFGAIQGSDIDNSEAIQKALNFSNVDLNGKEFKVANGIIISNTLSNGCITVMSNIDEPIKYVLDASNIWRNKIKDITIKGNNKAYTGVYASKGQNTNVIDNLYIEKCINYGLDLNNCYLGYYSNIFIWHCGTGIRLEAAHNVRLYRAETKYCNTGIDVVSGGSLILDTIDTSYCSNYDIFLEYSTATKITTWYTETHGENGALIKITNYGDISIDNVNAVGAKVFVELSKTYDNSSIISMLLSNIHTALTEDSKFIYNPNNVMVNNMIIIGDINNQDIELNSLGDLSYVGVAYINGKIVKKGEIPYEISKINGNYFNVVYNQREFSNLIDYVEIFNITDSAQLIPISDRPYTLGYMVFVTITKDNTQYNIVLNNGEIVSNNLPAEYFHLLSNDNHDYYYLQSITNENTPGIYKIETIAKPINISI